MSVVVVVVVTVVVVVVVAVVVVVVVAVVVVVVVLSDASLSIQGLFHPARKVRDVYWKIYNTLYIGAQVCRDPCPTGMRAWRSTLRLSAMPCVALRLVCGLFVVGRYPSLNWLFAVTVWVSAVNWTGYFPGCLRNCPACVSCSAHACTHGGWLAGCAHRGVPEHP